jgi:hypothetical protein
MVVPNDDEATSAQAYVENEMLPKWRIQRAELIRRAIDLIRPESKQRALCREDVEKVTLRLATGGAWLRAKVLGETKSGKQAVGRLAMALRRVEVVLKDEKLGGIYPGLFTRFISPDRLHELVQYYETVARKPSGAIPRQTAQAKRLAIAQARSLMTTYSASEADNGKKGSRLCKLASLLYGKPELDLSNQCKAALREKRKKAGQQ